MDLELIEKLEMSLELIEKMAGAAHDIWMEGRIRDGWTYGPIYNESNKQSPCIIQYFELSDEYKRSDRDLVIGIPKILEKVGFAIVRKPWLDALKEQGILT